MTKKNYPFSSDGGIKYWCDSGRGNDKRRGNLRATIHEQCCHSDSRVPVSEAAKKLARKTHNYNKWEAKQNRG